MVVTHTDQNGQEKEGSSKLSELEVTDVPACVFSAHLRYATILLLWPELLARHQYQALPSETTWIERDLLCEL